MSSLGRVGVIVSARLASRRLPGKALLPLAEIPMLGYLLRRIQSPHWKVIFATTTRSDDDALENLARAENALVFRGSENDLVDRYLNAADGHEIDTIARITADCPFVDAELIAYCLQETEKAEGWTVSSTKTLFPKGLDCEIFSTAALRQLATSTDLTEEDREHLTLHFYNHPERFITLPVSPDERWKMVEQNFTVDTPEDYQFASELAAALPGANTNSAEIVNFCRSHR